MAETSTKVVDKSAYQDHWERWVAITQRYGCTSFIVMKSTVDGQAVCFPICKGETEASVREEFEGKYLTYVGTHTLTQEEPG